MSAESRMVDSFEGDRWSLEGFRVAETELLPWLEDELNPPAPIVRPRNGDVLIPPLAETWSPWDASNPFSAICRARELCNPPATRNEGGFGNGPTRSVRLELISDLLQGGDDRHTLGQSWQ